MKEIYLCDLISCIYFYIYFFFVATAVHSFFCLLVCLYASLSVSPSVKAPRSQLLNKLEPAN